MIELHFPTRGELHSFRYKGGGGEQLMGFGGEMLSECNRRAMSSWFYFDGWLLIGDASARNVVLRNFIFRGLLS